MLPILGCVHNEIIYEMGLGLAQECQQELLSKRDNHTDVLEDALY